MTRVASLWRHRRLIRVDNFKYKSVPSMAPFYRFNVPPFHKFGRRKIYLFSYSDQFFRLETISFLGCLWRTVAEKLYEMAYPYVFVAVKFSKY